MSAPAAASHPSLAAGWAAAAALMLTLALPSLRADPLHVDELVVLEFAQRSLPAIGHDIFLHRGGGPLQFVVEHFSLKWPGGVEGLRVPSLIFAVLAVVAAGAWGVRLIGGRESIGLAFLLASSPLAVVLATFGRMYALFLLGVLSVGLLSLRAGRTGRRRDWMLAGGCAGALVYVHPIAPLYAPLALACGLAVPRRPLRELVPSVKVALLVGAVVAAPYVWALAVLARRYDVGTGGHLAATGDRPVPIESLLGLTPGGWVTACAAAVLACVGLVQLRRTRPHVALLLGLWVVAPILFFTLIPADTRFFVRYLLPELPALLLLVATGAFALGAWLGPARLVGAILVGALVAAGVADAVDRARTVRGIGLERALHDSDLPGALVFSSTGTPISDRPPEHLDAYVALRDAGIERLEELPAIDPRFDPAVEVHGRAAVADYLRAAGIPRRGVWIFRGPEQRVERAIRILGRSADVEAIRVSGTLLVARSVAPLPARPLVEQGVRVRKAWTVGSPSDRWTDALIEIDLGALTRDG